TPTLGPDATGVGWGFEYALVRDEKEIERLRKSVVSEEEMERLSQSEKKGKLTQAEFGKILDNLSPYKLRGFQDWYLKFWLKSVKGVSDVASVGGFVKQYQVTLNPGTLLQYKIPLQKVIQAIRKSNNEVGGRIVEFNGAEYIVRGRGYIKSVKDLYKVVVAHDMDGAPLLLEDIANISLGPEMRRGMTDLNGEGEVTGAIVVVRFGEDVLSVIKRVKKKLKDLAERKSLPIGSKIVITYDRSDLIMRAVETLMEKLIEESIIVSLVSIVFLFHFRSALVAIITLPLAIIISFMAMHFMGLSSNIMSLGGIAIAIGAMVDSAIVMVENAHKHLEHAPPGYNRKEVIIEAAKEVGRPLFFALLIITISFTPIFTLEGAEGKLFKPLAFTKTFAMFFASLISLTLVPILMVWLIKGKIMPEHKNPVNRFLIWAYNPIAHLTVHYRKTSMLIGLVIVLITIYPILQLEREFMPPLDEGTLMFMPVTIPGMSIEQARQIVKKQDKIIKTFPEVKWAFGKVGRADTATDPAPITMIETIIELKPKSEWREGYDLERLKNEMDRAVAIPGVSNSWTLPIKGRIDMLATGIRTNLG
ncbi:MAG TPA: efflux RND transporter permease subunit, partial [Spirochaetes bacterium]|nr:efflux RND transporter permease subunit [Spirochaetota bacterium]